MRLTLPTCSKSIGGWSTLGCQQGARLDGMGGQWTTNLDITSRLANGRSDRSRRLASLPRFEPERSSRPMRSVASATPTGPRSAAAHRLNRSSARGNLVVLRGPGQDGGGVGTYRVGPGPDAQGFTVLWLEFESFSKLSFDAKPGADCETLSLVGHPGIARLPRALTRSDVVVFSEWRREAPVAPQVQAVSPDASPSPDCAWRVEDPRPPTRVRPRPGDTSVVLAELDNGTEIHVVGRDGHWVEIDAPIEGWLFDSNIVCRMDPDRPDQTPVEPSLPASATWWCTCFSEQGADSQREITACRPSQAACLRLESAARGGGSRTIIGGSLSRACERVSDPTWLSRPGWERSRVAEGWVYEDGCEL